MDLTSPFKSDVLRPLTTWVIPGVIAVAPYMLVVGFYIHPVAAFWDAHPSASVAVVMMCALAAGLILDNIGASIENGWWDPALSRRYDDHLQNWARYLKLRIKDEIVGQRYLKTLVMKMKFELSMAPALLLFLVGVLWLNHSYRFWLLRGTLFASGLLVAGVLYFLRESFVSCRVLSRVRVVILEAVDEERAALANGAVARGWRTLP